MKEDLFSQGRRGPHFLGELSESSHSRGTHSSTQVLTAQLGSREHLHGLSTACRMQPVRQLLRLHRPSSLWVCFISSSNPWVAPAEEMTLDGFLLNKSTWTGWKRREGRALGDPREVTTERFRVVGRDPDCLAIEIKPWNFSSLHRSAKTFLEWGSVHTGSYGQMQQSSKHWRRVDARGRLLT